jgi:hypothetical protein
LVYKSTRTASLQCTLSAVLRSIVSHKRTPRSTFIYSVFSTGKRIWILNNAIVLVVIRISLVTDRLFVYR